MNGGTKFLLVLAVLIATAYGWYKANYPSYSWRQKMTVTVSTPHGEVSGSSVVAVEWRGNFFSGGWGGAKFHESIQGEATVVDLGDGKLLFALLSYPGAYEYTGLVSLNQFKGANDAVWSPQAFAKVLAAKDAGPAALSPTLYPMFVRFRDISDPKTVERVDPNNLAASFGIGTALVRATIEIIDNPITTGIEKKLVWLPGGFREKNLTNEGIGMPVRDVPPSHLLTYGAFWSFSK